MATPHVSGVAALVLAKNPAYSTAQIKGRLMASTDAKPSLTNKTVSGGRINAAKAVTAKTANQAPVADAGPDRTVKPGTRVTFAATATDADGQALRIQWKQLWGTPVTLGNATTAKASFTAPRTTGTMRFRMTVIDSQGAASVDEVDVTVSNWVG
jgi:subtilisin family serine protease